jgi:hypothetical protein
MTGPKNEADGTSSGTELLIRATRQIEAFHTPEGEGYVCVSVGNHKEVFPTKSKILRQWLSHLYYRSCQKTPSSQVLLEAIDHLDARAKFDGIEEAVHVRLAELNDAIYLDLGDPDWRVVEVTGSSWRVLDRSPVRFRRPRGMLALPIPTPHGSIRDLRTVINATVDENWTLIVSWVVAAFRPTGPYTVLNLIGEQGSAKSTSARILKSLIDPSKALLRSVPREERDLMISARHAHALAFDNLSGITPWLSDALCRLSTGGGFATRELYTDSDEVIFDATRPVILCGIDDIATREDLLDRSLVAMLPQLTPDNRRGESEVWQAFRLMHSGVLGGLLDAVSLALREFPSTELLYRPRMFDFAKWVAAAEPSLPWARGKFIEAYRTNRSDVVRASLGDDPLVETITRLLAIEPTWSGTATQLVARLRAIAQGARVPTTPRVLSSALRRAAAFLREEGVNARFEKVGKKRTRTIFLEVIGESSSAASASSA